MAKVTFSPVMAKLSEFGSTSIFEATTPNRGKTEFIFNSKHRLLMVFDADDTNPHCRHKRFSEFQIPEGIPLNQLTTRRLLDACTNLPFSPSEGRRYSKRFVNSINRACMWHYANALKLVM